MSAVRMCDKCGKIFSENAPGWTTFTGSTMRMVEGRRTTVQQSMDLCPPCTDGTTAAQNPYAIAATAPDARTADAVTQPAAATAPGGYRPDNGGYPR